ncbi:twin-arginine translocation signal domain-containing protein [Aliiruegeria lutimaris]|uniref:Tat (Twin-arginine translocation) pathway signal sequence n=1 Tax=Aliiruegeria lutimaris TaxID=571298 RepID=A0A1G9J1Y4_9RHOB|nr:twin-arginine translocation signal domain-containing protein [Aliiruegeria lutimaris]SDL31490.1 Tat (twin-arginine translocation) pathway signal sequence [Aliiruegeria lutimaris]
MKRRDLLKAAPAALVASGATGLIPLKVRAAPGGAQVTAAQKFRVGEMTVTALSDGFIQSPRLGANPPTSSRIGFSAKNQLMLLSSRK